MVKEGRSKDDQSAIASMASEFLKQMCGTSAALEMTPHFLVKHAFEVANALADEIMNDEEVLFQRWKDKN